MKGMTKESFIEKAIAFYDKMREELDDTEQDFYEYEEKFDELMTLFGKELLEEGLGSVPEDIRKKKKNPNAIWQNSHSRDTSL